MCRMLWGTPARGVDDACALRMGSINAMRAQRRFDGVRGQPQDFVRPARRVSRAGNAAPPMQGRKGEGARAGPCVRGPLRDNTSLRQVVAP